MTVKEIKIRIIQNGIKELRKIYPDADIFSLITNEKYNDFFLKMIRSNLGISPKIDAAILELIEKFNTLNNGRKK